VPTFKGNPLATHGLLYNEEYLDAIWTSFRVEMEEDGIVFARLGDDLRHCPSCNLYFAPARVNQTYCRPACRQAAYEQRQGQDFIPIGQDSATAVVRKAEKKDLADDDLDDVLPVVPPSTQYPMQRPRKS
jgi:hypothetical protein